METFFAFLIFCAGNSLVTGEFRSVLGPILFLLFINDISNFTVEGCVLNMYADDVIIHTSATSKDALEYRLQVCIDNISNWYSMNKLCVNKKKFNVMVIGSKWQLKSLNLDDVTISVDSGKLLLAKQAKYLGLWVNDLSWDDHILILCRKMYYYFHMFRRLRKNLPSALPLNIYQTYVHPCAKVMAPFVYMWTFSNFDFFKFLNNLGLSNRSVGKH